MTTKTRNWFLVVFILVFPFVLFFGFLITELNKPFAPLQPLPNPNGYDDFVKAGKIVADTNNLTEYEYDKLNQKQLREVVAKNVEGLRLARIGLSNECRVSIQFSQVYPENHLDELAGLKKLAYSFAAEGQLAEIENRPNDAAKSYLDVIRLGNESSRGGVLIDELVGIAIEDIGTIYLQKLMDQLDAKSCRETAAALETLDSQRQTWNEVMQQENDWSRRAFPGLWNELSRLMTRKSLDKAFQHSEQHFKNQQLKTRELTINFAERAYELDKGKPPASVTDLVPDYLKAIPQDPFTGTNMVYSPR